jgi:hypothetical protein
MDGADVVAGCVVFVVGPVRHQGYVSDPFYIENMVDILDGLRTLFPGCSVKYKKITFAIGRDGKEYDISTIDTSLYQLVDLRHSKTEEHIVIDWS